MQLFLVFFGLNILGFGINPWIAAAIAFTLHASAFLGEIWRGCIEAVPPGQREAATALGLRYYNRMRYVILPQAVKIAVAPTVGFLVQLIKGTSLAAIIGFTELTRQGQIINNATFGRFWSSRQWRRCISCCAGRFPSGAAHGAQDSPGNDTLTGARAGGRSTRHK